LIDFKFQIPIQSRLLTVCCLNANANYPFPQTACILSFAYPSLGFGSKQ
jgi:hypothetical protein